MHLASWEWRRLNNPLAPTKQTKQESVQKLDWKYVCVLGEGGAEGADHKEMNFLAVSGASERHVLQMGLEMLTTPTEEGWEAQPLSSQGTHVETECLRFP